MDIRIAIPEPTSTDAAYNARSLPPYIAALQSAGALPVVVPLHERPDRVARLLAKTQGVLLPGSGFDVSPESYGQARIPACGPSDAARAAVDELLLQDAFNLRKAVFAICHGMQTLNVWLNGSLVQDLETQTRTAVNHRAGRDVDKAHALRIIPGSRLLDSLTSVGEGPVLEVHCNSSHHQAVDRVGDNLRITAVSPQDEVVEAVELQAADHFVVGVQWHPERTYASEPLSRAIFSAFVSAAKAWQPRLADISVERA